MKTQFIIAVALIVNVIFSPHQLFAATNDNQQSAHDDAWRQRERERDAIAKQKEIEEIEARTKASEDALNSIRSKAGLKPIEKATLGPGRFSALWNDWVESKESLIDATYRQSVASSMTVVQLDAAARLCLNTSESSHQVRRFDRAGQTIELDRSRSSNSPEKNAAEMLRELLAEKEVAKARKEALEIELGITNDTIQIDAETMKLLETADHDLSISYGIEKALKERIKAEEAQDQL